MSKPLRLKLPKPESLNNAYSNSKSGGRYLTEVGKLYKDEVGWLARAAAMEQRWTYGGERLKLTMLIHFPDRRRRDISNAIKLCEDALAEALGFDDEVIDEWHIWRGEIRKPGCAHVTVEVAGRGKAT